MTHYMDGTNNLSAAAEKRRDVFSWHSARVLLIRINWDYLLTHQKRVCCIHVTVLRSRHASVFLYLDAAGDLGVVQ